MPEKNAVKINVRSYSGFQNLSMADHSLRLWQCAALSIGLHLAVLASWGYAPANPAVWRAPFQISLQEPQVRSAAPETHNDHHDMPTGRESLPKPHQPESPSLRPRSSSVSAAGKAAGFGRTNNDGRPTDDASLEQGESSWKVKVLAAPKALNDAAREKPNVSISGTRPVAPQALTDRAAVKGASGKTTDLSQTTTGQGSKQRMAGYSTTGNEQTDRSDFEAPPRVLADFRPVYPQQARDNGWEGVVRLRISINASGQPQRVEVLHSSGYSILDQSAVEAARKWRYAAAVHHGHPTDSLLDLPVHFRLEDDE